MKSFERAWERVSHWTTVGVLLTVVLMVMTFCIIVYCGPMIVDLGAPTGAMKREFASFLYGLLTVLLVHLVTGGWLIKETIREWLQLDAMHETAMSRLN